MLDKIKKNDTEVVLYSFLPVIVKIREGLSLSAMAGNDEKKNDLQCCYMSSVSSKAMSNPTSEV